MTTMITLRVLPCWARAGRSQRNVSNSWIFSTCITWTTLWLNNVQLYAIKILLQNVLLKFGLYQYRLLFVITLSPKVSPLHVYAADVGLASANHGLDWEATAQALMHSGLVAECWIVHIFRLHFSNTCSQPQYSRLWSPTIIIHILYTYVVRFHNLLPCGWLICRKRPWRIYPWLSMHDCVLHMHSLLDIREYTDFRKTTPKFVDKRSNTREQVRLLL